LSSFDGPAGKVRWILRDLPVRPGPMGHPPVVPFVLVLVLTVGLLIFALVTGIRGPRNLHVKVSCAALLALGLAIYLAEVVGGFWVFPKIPLRVHLSFAIPGALMGLVTAVSGVLVLKDRCSRRTHRRIVSLFLLLVLAASTTGVWIFWVGRAKPL